MTLETIRAILGWCIIMNCGVYIWWVLCLKISPELVYRIHMRFIPVGKDSFYSIHYAGLMSYKLAIFLFNMIPYFALRIVG